MIIIISSFSYALYSFAQLLLVVFHYYCTYWSWGFCLVVWVFFNLFFDCGLIFWLMWPSRLLGQNTNSLSIWQVLWRCCQVFWHSEKQTRCKLFSNTSIFFSVVNELLQFLLICQLLDSLLWFVTNHIKGAIWWWWCRSPPIGKGVLGACW